MLEGFICAAAVVLLLLVMFAFAGCTAHVSGPEQTLTLGADLIFEADPEDPWPPTEKIVFQWSVVPFEGERQTGEEAIREGGEPQSGGGTTRIPFSLQVPHAASGDWCISCRYFTREENEGGEVVSRWWPDDTRALTLDDGQDVEVRFEIRTDDAGGWQVARTEGDPCH